MAHLRFGLEEAHRRALAEVFDRHPGVRRVLIFGSRAKGTERDSSDIDLAVEAPDLDESGFSRLWNDIQAVPLVFKVDLLHLERLGRPELVAAIRREGKVFFPDPTMP